MESILVIPPSPGQPGSRGDQAVALATVDALRPSGREPVFAVVDPGHPEWQFLGGENVRLTPLAEFRPGDYGGVICLGTDVFDGSYGIGPTRNVARIAGTFARQGKPAAILGLSIRPDAATPVRRSIEQLHRQVTFALRDPSSFARFRLLCPDAMPILVADPAFLLKAGQAPADVADWVRERRREHKLCIGINLNRHMVTDIESTLPAFVELLAGIPAAGFVLIPHDSRPRPGDLDICKRLYELALPRLGDNIFLLSLCGARDIKAVCRQLDAVVTGRMHLAIACLSQCIPALAIDYNFKMKGLFSMFGLQQLVVGMQDMHGLLPRFLERLPEYSARLAPRLDKVKWLAGRNFRHREPPEDDWANDRARFCAWSAAFQRPRYPRPLASARGLSRDNFRALLTIDAHRVEKGLAMPQPRGNFGMESNLLYRLLANLGLYLKRFEPDDTTDMVISALSEYAAFSTSPAFARAFAQLLGSHGLQTPGDRSGGTVTATRDEILRRSAMDLADFFSSRSSTRNFSAQPVAEEIVRRAVAMAHDGTPSVCNRQPYRVRVYTGAGRGRLLELQNGNKGFGELVDKLLLVTVDTQCFEKFSERNQPWVAGGLFCMSLMYALHSLGVATCPLNWDVSAATDMELRERTAIPDSEVVIMMIAAGNYPDQFRVARSRRVEVSRWLEFLS